MSTRRHRRDSAPHYRSERRVREPRQGAACGRRRASRMHRTSPRNSRENVSAPWRSGGRGLLTFLLTFGARKGPFGRVYDRCRPDLDSGQRRPAWTENPRKKALFSGEKSLRCWRARQDSNLWPSAPEAENARGLQIVRGLPCMATDGAFGAPGESARRGSAASAWSAPTPISMRPRRHAPVVPAWPHQHPQAPSVHASGLNLGFLMRQLTAPGRPEPPGPRPRARRGSDPRAELRLAARKAFPDARSLPNAGSRPDLLYDTASSPWTARATDKQFCHGLLAIA